MAAAVEEDRDGRCFASRLALLAMFIPIHAALGMMESECVSPGTHLMATARYVTNVSALCLLRRWVGGVLKC